jgi:hypothetical protein
VRASPLRARRVSRTLRRCRATYALPWRRCVNGGQTPRARRTSPSTCYSIVLKKKTRRARLGYNSGSRQPHCGRFTSKPVHHVTALDPSNSRRATTDRLSGTAGAGIDDGSRHEAPCQDDCRQSGGRAWPNSSSRPLASSPETTRRAEPPASGFGGLHTPWRLNAAQHRLQLAQGELRDAQTADGRGFSVQHPGKRGAKP